MFNNNWSTEQIEQELAAGTRAKAGTDTFDPGYEPPLSSTLGKDAAAVLSKVTDLLENQSLFKSEVRSLRDEIDQLRKENRDERSKFTRAAEEMERELADLRQAKADLERLLGAARGRKVSPPQFPDEEYLARPLVIRTSQSEYLGVLGKVRKHFALRDFVYLVETSANGRRVDLAWELKGGHWSLVVTLEEAGNEQHFILVTQKTVTPSKNVVTEIVRMNVNGSDVPDSLLLSLFKKIKDTFDRQNP
jgi:hypothetical protein